MLAEIAKVICPKCKHANLYGFVGEIKGYETIKCNECDQTINVVENIEKD